jgi:hypothetical protein
VLYTAAALLVAVVLVVLSTSAASPAAFFSRRNGAAFVRGGKPAPFAGAATEWSDFVSLAAVVVVVALAVLVSGAAALCVALAAGAGVEVGADADAGAGSCTNCWTNCCVSCWVGCDFLFGVGPPVLGLALGTREGNSSSLLLAIGAIGTAAVLPHVFFGAAGADAGAGDAAADFDP